jgi:glycosyltransferase involved in cell wall biosynthesis
MQHAKVCLAPLRFGAGLKGKLVDAMKNGTPCVMTSMASEGMFGNMESNGFIEDDPQEFANKAVQLYNDEFIWKAKQHSGFQAINKRFNKTDFQMTLSNRIEETAQQLNNHRLNNFTGQMLQHHSMQSTKFMSKWIEEKNAVGKIQK